MEDDGEAGRVLGEQRQGRVGRVAGVDDHGQSRPARQVDVVEKDVFLHVVRPVVVVEVEARLPHGHHPRAVRQLLEAGHALVVRSPASCG